MKRFLKITVIIMLSIGFIPIMQSCQKPTAPVVTTVSVSGVTQTSATSGGNVTDDGGAAVTARGVCWGSSQNPTTGSSKTSDGTGTSTFTSSITGLTANNTYYVRAYATNSEGTSYGNEVSFTTNPIILATLTTTPATSITSTTAITGGNITDDGGAEVTSRGVCWNTSQNPTIGDPDYYGEEGSGTGTFIFELGGIYPNNTYYVRAYAINSAGTSYGNQVSFTTLRDIIFNPNLTYGTMTDVDGNTYKTIQIGTQNWMAENLKITKYNDGTAIPNVTDGTAWSNLTTPGYCWYDNNETFAKNTYGALYNWYAVNTGKLCPTGWHLPLDAEWTTLITFLGGEDVAGGKLKETGTIHWSSPNTGATNESGFTAIPAGERFNTGPFFYLFNDYGYWWSATEYSITGNAYYRYMSYDNSCVYWGYNYNKDGLSVRCLKD
jgi:uncharacterized protein (TIGR02145 family)